MDNDENEVTRCCVGLVIVVVVVVVVVATLVVERGNA
jgi:hypothetical protein